MPKAISVLWKLIKDKKIKEENKRATLIDFDKVLGLNIEKIEKEIIPPLIEDLAYQREKLRKEKKWEEADKLRKEIEKNGYRIDDTKKGPIIKKIK